MHFGQQVLLGQTRNSSRFELLHVFVIARVGSCSPMLLNGRNHLHRQGRAEASGQGTCIVMVS